jgi:predicted O-methyltransferase YrrM
MRTHDLSPREKYVESLYTEKEDRDLLSVRERLIAAGRWGVNIGPNEGRILQILLMMIGARKVVEIGTLFGYSTVWMARALMKSGTVEKPKLFTIERDHECVRQARRSFEECGVSEIVTTLEGEASDCLYQIKSEGPFDLVFIDANKSAYVEYLEWAWSNVRPGGLIVADNTFLGGGVVEESKPSHLSQNQWSAMRLFNELLSDESRFLATILPTTEGLSIAIRK